MRDKERKKGVENLNEIEKKLRPWQGFGSRLDSSIGDKEREKERQAGEKDKRKKKRRAGNKRTMIKRVDFDKKNYALEKKRESTVLT